MRCLYVYLVHSFSNIPISVPRVQLSTKQPMPLRKLFTCNLVHLHVLNRFPSKFSCRHLHARCHAEQTQLMLTQNMVCLFARYIGYIKPFVHGYLATTCIPERQDKQIKNALPHMPLSLYKTH